MPSKVLIAALAATAIATGGVAYAANQPVQNMPPGQTATLKDFGKLSADGARAYQDLTLTRLAIFDGRVNDAKKFINQADQSFTKAKTDDSVFTKSEADLRTQVHQSSNQASTKDNGGSDMTASKTAAQSAQQPGNDVTKPIAWLPVDGTVSLNEDYTMQPTKSKAIAEANKSLAKGDRKGAMDKLKLADVDVNVTTAVVPLQQTINDVHQAAQLVDSGKYYEGSQKLRAVQDSAIILVDNMPASPKAAMNKGAAETGGTPSADQAASPAPAKK